MAKTLEAHDKLIREIFEGSYQFEIPDYQRPNAWTTEQAAELFDDLYSAMQDARDSVASSQYFLGSIVLIKAYPHAFGQASATPCRRAEKPLGSGHRSTSLKVMPSMSAKR